MHIPRSILQNPYNFSKAAHTDSSSVWAVFFMKKMVKRFVVLFLVVGCFLLGDILMDKNTLRQELIRLHVVAASDSAEDQAVKLQVRDAVMASLQQALSDATDVQQAKAYIEAHLPQIEAAAKSVLQKMGVEDRVSVQFLKETFSARDYDTFSLPAGVYESLRIIIGEGNGKNWWCVLFPQLCIPDAQGTVEDVAVGAGFSQQLTSTVTQKEGYRIRFYLLDLLGRLENFFSR